MSVMRFLKVNELQHLLHDSLSVQVIEVVI